MDDSLYLFCSGLVIAALVWLFNPFGKLESLMGFLLNSGSAKLPDGVRSFDDMPGARFSKVPIINGPDKLSPFTFTMKVSIVLHLTLSVSETKWSSLLARTHAFILYILIRARNVTGIFEKRPLGPILSFFSLLSDSPVKVTEVATLLY